MRDSWQAYRGIPQCYELPSIKIFPMVLYPIFDCFLKWFLSKWFYESVYFKELHNKQEYY